MAANPQGRAPERRPHYRQGFSCFMSSNCSYSQGFSAEKLQRGLISRAESKTNSDCDARCAESSDLLVISELQGDPVPLCEAVLIRMEGCQRLRKRQKNQQRTLKCCCCIFHKRCFFDIVLKSSATTLGKSWQFVMIRFRRFYLVQILKYISARAGNCTREVSENTVRTGCWDPRKLTVIKQQ